MGYFGLSYAIANEGKVKAVKVDGGDGCVEPTNDTVQNGTYKPLSRPLFIYPSKKALQNEATSAFVKFYVDNYDAIAQQAQFVPMTAEQAQKAKDTVTQLEG